MKSFLAGIAILLFCNNVFSQTKINKYHSSDLKFKEIIDEFGEPLKGKSLLIMNYFSTNTGSLYFFLNESKSKNNAFLTDEPKDLHAGIFLEDHGGLLEKITFKDFAVGLSQPVYLEEFCNIQDIDNNSYPEFYLMYFTESDGLDAKPLKLIIYTSSDKGKTYQKSKITAWIPFQPEDKLKIEKDSNFNNLDKKIQQKAEQSLNQAIKTLE